jgi:hypothetical protein
MTKIDVNSNLHKLVYCSRNRIRGNDAEVAAELETLLASARVNNLHFGITGALLYNAGNFAQVLEGPMHSVDRIFEAIQRDRRHGETIVIHNGPAAERDFPEWSMAFSGSHAPAGMPLATTAFDAAFANSVGAGEQILSLLKELIVREDDNWTNPEVPSYVDLGHRDSSAVTR